MSSTEPPRHELSELSRADFIIIAASVFAISGVLGAYFVAHNPITDEPAKLTDLLIIAITLSGITIPVMITYMSLGRNRDVFSELGDAVPFFLNKAGIEGTDLANALLRDDTVGHEHFNLDVAALDEMNSLRSASGIYLSPKYKLHLVPAAVPVAASLPAESEAVVDTAQAAWTRTRSPQGYQFFTYEGKTFMYVPQTSPYW